MHNFASYGTILPEPSADCLLMELWDLPAAGTTFLTDVSSWNDAAQYPSCINGTVGSGILVNTTLNTATVAYYTGTTPGSKACFVCDEDSGYELNTTKNERVCRSNGTWSGNFMTCGMLSIELLKCCICYQNGSTSRKI